MAGVLNDEGLHEFVGGRPLTRAELRERYRGFVTGSPTPGEQWLNWIVRLKAGEKAIGTLQATISTTGRDRPAAELAWVIGTPWQMQGFASEAARAIVDWLHERGIDDLSAHIHACHSASEGVARRAGLRPTSKVHDGETLWRSS
jgi:RimJ/RimL family protein N-acetyltransferase